MMICVIFMVVFARSDEFEFSVRLIGSQETNFAGRMTRDIQKKKTAAARALHFDSKTLVCLFVEQGISFGRT